MLGSHRLRWGTITDYGCSSEGKRKHASRLWGLSADQSQWKEKCETEAPPVTINEEKFDHPTKCINKGQIEGEWGEWDLTDPICSGWNWGTITPKRCETATDGSVTTTYSAILWHIPSGVDWDFACEHAPATIKGTTYPKPTRCLNPKTHSSIVNEWGEWDVPTGNTCEADKSNFWVYFWIIFGIIIFIIILIIIIILLVKFK